jgi:hypothetical protein
VYRTAIQTAYTVPQSNSATYPTNNALGNQLKVVAKLINGGLKTPIYIVNHPFTHDSHEAQVNVTDKTTGSQPTNLGVLSKAIGAFQQDLGLMGKADKVTGMTFSEFGRRIKSNGSLGTDHGSAAPVIVFGAALNTSPTAVAGTAHPIPGMIGASPNLPINAGVSDQVPRQFEFKQIYATVLQDWLCMSEAQTNEVLGGSFIKLPIFSTTILSTTKFDLDDSNFINVFPNPVTNRILNIQFKEPISDFVAVEIYSMQGTLIYKNSHKVNQGVLQFEVQNLTSTGTYIMQVNYNQNKFFKKIVVK